MRERIRWGILGTGGIASRFATALGELADAELVAVGSRSAEAAEAFGGRFAIPRRHPSYASLVADPEVDVVYVASPHIYHRDHSIMALEAGRHVLVEKPLAINAAEASAMIAVARERGLFMMEAMWTRFLPLYVELRSTLAAGTLGPIELFWADFGINPGRTGRRQRLFDSALGGGALLDLGIYGVSLASMIFGPATRVAAIARLGESEVDETGAVLLGYPSGQLAGLCVSIAAATPTEALVAGPKGSIRVHRFFNRPSAMTLSLDGRPGEVIERPFAGNGYTFEAAEVMRCLRAGRLESEVMPLEENLSIMRTMDEIRAQVGVRYPTE